MSEPLPIPVMDFDPVAFANATGMFNDDEKWKYIRCLTFYWTHSHVEGLPDDDAGLRELCNCELHNWMRLKSMIFDNDKFFCLEDGKWHQKRARANYLKKQEDLIKRQAQTSTARTERTAQSVTKANTKSEDFLEDLSKSPAYIGIDVKREFEKAKVWIGLPQNKGRVLSQRFFVNWLNKVDRQIASGTTAAPSLQPPNRISMEQELNRVVKELGNYSSRLSDYDKDSPSRIRLENLRARQKELRELLGVIA
jgi:uncharacterized protein YdaU (DUF1376 family)